VVYIQLLKVLKEIGILTKPDLGHVVKRIWKALLTFTDKQPMKLITGKVSSFPLVVAQKHSEEVCECQFLFIQPLHYFYFCLPFFNARSFL